MAYYLYLNLAALGAAALIAGAIGMLLWRPLIRPRLIAWGVRQSLRVRKHVPRLAARRAR